MLENKGKEGKNRRRGKNEAEESRRRRNENEAERSRRRKKDNEFEKTELIFKEDGQEYAQVTKMLGNGRLEALCFDGTKRLCRIRGKLRKKVWIYRGDIILVGLRDYQDAKADVILKYKAYEARNLKTYGEIPEAVMVTDRNNIPNGLFLSSSNDLINLSDKHSLCDLANSFAIYATLFKRAKL